MVGHNNLSTVEAEEALELEANLSYTMSSRTLWGNMRPYLNKQLQQQ